MNRIRYQKNVQACLMACVLWCAGNMFAAAQNSQADAPGALQRVYRQMQAPEIQWQAGKAYASSPGENAHPLATTILEQMAGSKDPAQRAMALQAISASGSHAELDRLVNALADADAGVREAAAEGLRISDAGAVFDAVMRGYLGGSNTQCYALDGQLVALRGALEFPMLDVLENTREPEVRRCIAAHCLGMMNSPAAVQPLAGLAWSKNQQLAFASMRALVSSRNPAAMMDLVRLVAHPQESFRLLAVEGLAALGGLDAEKTLEGVVSSPQETSVPVRVRAAQVLGDWGAKSAVPALLEASLKEPEVRLAATDSLRRITGKQFGESAQQWWTWYETVRESWSRDASPLVPRQGRTQAVSPTGPMGPLSPAVPPGYNQYNTDEQQKNTGEQRKK